MVQQDENSPFFQGSGGPAESMPARPQLSENEVPQQEVPAEFVDSQSAQQYANPSVTLGEVRDNLSASYEAVSAEPPTLEVSESAINDAFNKRFGTVGTLDLGDEVSAPAPVQKEAAPEYTEPKVVAPQEITPVIEPQSVSPKIPEVPVELPVQEVEGVDILALQEQQDQIQEEFTQRMSAQVDSTSAPKMGSVEDRKDRLRKMAQRKAPDSVQQEITQAKNVPRGQNANPDIPGL